MTDTGPSAKHEIYLTITGGYAPTWETWEGVREFVQNWYDGVLDSYEEVSPPLYGIRRSLKFKEKSTHFYEANLVHGNKPILLGTLAYEKDKQRLTLINHNTELLTKVLLLGYTSKKGHQDIVGQFGEGLKIGTLALLRTGHKVLVATKNKTWNFKIQKHPQFQESVLTVSIEDNASGTPSDFNTSVPFRDGDTVSQIWPIKEEEWNKWDKRFLFLVQPKEYVDTELGSLLFDEHQLTQLYVKKIWVEDRTEKGDLHVGVNFKDLQIDRDRRAVLYQSEIDHNVAIMWAKALKLKPELAARYFQLLEKSDHTSDVRLANMYLEDKGVVRLLADEFFKLYGQNAIPVPNSSAAERLSYLHKELQEKVILCNQNLIDILKKSGKVRMVEDILNKPRPDISVGRKLFKDVPHEQILVLAEAEQFVKMITPHFTTGNVEFHDGKDAMVTYYGDSKYEVPQWMLCPEYIHQFIACPAANPDACFCAPSFLCERILAAIGPHKNDAGDRKVQEFVMTLAVQAKGKRPKRSPMLSSTEEVLRRNEEELQKTIDFLTSRLSDEQKKQESGYEDMRLKLAQFQAQLANEDVRFVERENDLIAKQKAERDTMTRAYQEQLKIHEQEKQNLEEDFLTKCGELQHEKKKKMEAEAQVEKEKERHKNEIILRDQESLMQRKKLVTSTDQMSQLQCLVKKSEISNNSPLCVELQEAAKKAQQDYQSENCIVCSTSKKDCHVLPCKHQFCSMCCEAGLKLCPICYEDIKNIQK